MVRRSLSKGIYAPLPTFFHDNEEIDFESYKKVVKFIASAGATPTVCGSLGEAVHLSHSERSDLIKCARQTLDSENLQHVPILAGIAASSTREVIQLSKEAAEAGADFAQLIPPAYYAKSLDFEALKKFYVDVAKESPLPIVMYNFPAVSGGIDLDSNLIESVVREAPNVVCVKLTCGSLGKLTRITSVVHDEEFIKKYPRTTSEPFMIIDGLIDFLLPSIHVGGAATMPALANFVPRSCNHLWKLCQPESLANPESLKEAIKLQGHIAQADAIVQPIGIPGVKGLMRDLYNYPGTPRRPLVNFDKEKSKQVLQHPSIKYLLELENSLSNL